MSDEAALTAFDVETLDQFRMELRLQGGVTSPLEHDASAVPRETMRGEKCLRLSKGPLQIRR